MYVYRQADTLLSIYLISSKTDKPNFFFFLFNFFTLFWNKHIETRPWICKQMVNYYSSANVGSPQHFILLQIIMIWKGQVPTVITQSDKRNQTSVRLNDNTLQFISSLESINLFHMRAPTRFFFYLGTRFFY